MDVSSSPRTQLENLSLHSHSYFQDDSQAREAHPLPIAVPFGGRQDAYAHGNTLSTGESARYANEGLSPIEMAMRSRKSSIAFNPSVSLDGVSEHPLQSPLPKSHGKPRADPRDERSFAGSAGGRNGLYESNMSGSTGARSANSGGYKLAGAEPARRLGSRRSSAASRFLAAQFSTPAPTDDGAFTEQAPSLTSGSTLSPLSDFHTPPPNSLGAYFNDEILESPLEDSVSMRETSAWPKSASKMGIGRAQSLNFQQQRPHRSQTRTGNVPRRAFSDRSPNRSSKGPSPASLFLTQYNAPAIAAPKIEPDSEGQEVGSYVLGKVIGSGGFSTVKEAFTIEGDYEIKRAVKIVRKRASDADSENDTVQANLEHEVSLWRCLNHPHILNLIAVYDTHFATFAFMQYNEGGSLFDIIRKNRQGLSARLAQRYAFQLACALRYLHEDMRIIHGDIKLENCLVNTDHDSEEGGNLLLCDFGLARFIQSPHEDEDDAPLQHPQLKKVTHEDTCEIQGSLPYASPEMLNGTGLSMGSVEADIWAFGITLFRLFTGRLPFSSAMQAQLRSLIEAGNWDRNAVRSCWGLRETESRETEIALELLEGCLEKDPLKRWTIRRVMDSEWFEGLGSESP